MKVHIRSHKNKKSGTVYYNLDCFINGERYRAKLDAIYKDDTPAIKDTKRKKHEMARAALQQKILLGDSPLANQDKRSVLFFPFAYGFLSGLSTNVQIKMKAMLKTLGKVYPQDLTFGQVEANVNFIADFRRFMEGNNPKPLAGATVHGYHTMLNKVLTEAIRQKFLMPSKDMQVTNKLTKRGRKVRDLLTLDDIMLLEAAQLPMDNQELFNEVKKAFLFAWYTCLGRAELYKVRSCHIIEDKDKDGNTVHFFNMARSKTGESLKFYLSEKAMKHVDRSRDYLFNLPSKRYVAWIVSKWGKAAGIGKHLTTYSFRHSSANHLVRQGANPVALQIRMGWTDIKMYKNYIVGDKEEDFNLASTL